MAFWVIAWWTMVQGVAGPPAILARLRFSHAAEHKAPQTPTARGSAARPEALSGRTASAGGGLMGTPALVGVAHR